MPYLFRGRFLDWARRRFPRETWPKDLWRKEGVVYRRSTFGGPQGALERRGRYVHRVALSNNRIQAAGEDHVRFAYRPVDGKAWRTMRLAPEEFLRRLLQHVLPPGVHKVRYYGLWAASNRRLLRRVQTLLGPVDPQGERQGRALRMDIRTPFHPFASPSKPLRPGPFCLDSPTEPFIIDFAALGRRR